MQLYLKFIKFTKYIKINKNMKILLINIKKIFNYISWTNLIEKINIFDIKGVFIN